MDEKKEQEMAQGKQESALKKGAKDQAKKSAKEIFKKIIKKLAPLLLKLFIILMLALVAVAVVSYINDLFTSSNTKEIVGGRISYTYVPMSSSDEADDEKPEPGYRINVVPDLENKGYAINCKFISPSGDPIDEANIIGSTKNGLKAANINPALFTDSEIRILAVLGKNGLKFEDYSAEYLKCLPLFIKAEIASQNFDLRDVDHIGEPVDIATIAEQDFIYGTLQIQRTTIKDNGDDDPEYESNLLDYIEYGDESTEGTFKYLIETKDIDEGGKHFSLDENGNLVVINWSRSETTIGYTDEDSNSLTDEQIASIPSEVRGEANSIISVRSSIPVDYKDAIKVYSLSSGFLSDLLIATQNPTFCSDLCELAFNNSILIDLREELTHRETTTNTTYVRTDLMQEFVIYSLVGDNVTSTRSWELIESGYGPTPWNDLRSRYPDIDDSTKYKVESGYNGSQLEWKLYRNRTDTQSTPQVLTPSSFETEYGDLINNGTMDGISYTESTRDTYNITKSTVSDNNSYKLEISKIDGWFLKYDKKYDTPEKKFTTSSSDSGMEVGEYERHFTRQTTDQAEMDADARTVAFLEEKIAEKRRTTSLQNIRGHLEQLTFIDWIREDLGSSSVTNTTSFKYGEEIPETTEVQLKNVQFVDDVPKFVTTYTDEDGNEQDEIGILFIYDRHVKQRDLFLQDDADQKFFEMLEQEVKGETESTAIYSKIMKFLLYAYDGIFRGESDLDLNIFKPKDFRLAGFTGGNAIAEVLRSYENDWLRKYRNGTATAGDIQLVLERQYARENPDTGEVEYGLIEMHYKSDNSLNYSYGLLICTYSSTGVQGPILADKDVAFSAEGVNLQERVDDYKSGGRGWINADLADRVQIKLINDTKQLIREEYANYEYNGAPYGVELSGNELDALVIASYGYGNVKPTYSGVTLLREYKAETDEAKKEILKEKIISEFSVNGGRFHPFTYGDWVISGRAATMISMFFDGRYFLKTGEEIDPGLYMGGEFLQVADSFHERMETEVWYYYTDTSSYSLYWNDIEKSVNNTKATCCATYVGSVIYLSGLKTEEEMNSFNYNECNSMYGYLSKDWEIITSKEDLVAGDVVFFDYEMDNSLDHVEIYGGEGGWFGAGSTGSIQNAAPSTWSNDYLMRNFSIALRPH